ncbi:MAG: hypothetical protein H3C62_10760 [Gemmatimonadaceae bacterium]|nr:hypothetical protein [Gemmatimonadaceae bacterium]
MAHVLSPWATVALLGFSLLALLAFAAAIASAWRELWSWHVSLEFAVVGVLFAALAGMSALERSRAHRVARTVTSALAAPNTDIVELGATDSTVLIYANGVTSSTGHNTPSITLSASQLAAIVHIMEPSTVVARRVRLDSLLSVPTQPARSMTRPE